MLEIRNLVKVYPGSVAALQGVSLAIPNGLFGLLGPNGSGKTTLMRIVTGLLLPSAGQVLLDGEDVTQHPERLWPRLGYLPQDFGFYPKLSGRVMLRHLLTLKGVRGPRGLDALCSELLDRVNLGFAADRKVETYSGGMRQRLGIAQALAGDPRLVVVDEPTSGLDPEERNRFYRLLAELAAERIVVLSTHLIEDVAMLCPRFAVLCQGRVLAETTPAEARASVAGRIFEGEADGERRAACEARGRITSAYWVEGRHRVRLFVPAGEPPSGFSPAVPSLEDAYLVLTGATP